MKKKTWIVGLAMAGVLATSASTLFVEEFDGTRGYDANSATASGGNWVDFGNRATGDGLATASTGESVVNGTTASNDPQIRGDFDVGLDAVQITNITLRLRADLDKNGTYDDTLTDTDFQLNWNSVPFLHPGAGNNGASGSVKITPDSITAESDGWHVMRASFALEQLIGVRNSIRIDPVNNVIGATYEVDYLLIEGDDSPPPPPETNTVWQFNTLGDTEGWEQDSGNNIDAFDVTNSVSGSEIVLASQGISGSDPRLIRVGTYTPGSNYWSKAIIRARQLATDDSPLPWNSDGCAVVIGGIVISPAIGGEGWNVVTQSNEWIVASISISGFSTNDISGLRFDPVGGSDATNKNFEVDYIQLTTSQTPPPPPPPPVKTLMQAWEFNNLGDTEGFVAVKDIDGLTVADDIDGSNTVLTCTSVTGIDPQPAITNASVSAGEGTWDTLEIRARRLAADGGPSTGWLFNGTLILVNGINLGNIPGTHTTITNEPGNWITATCDISSLGSADLTYVRVDPVGNNATLNFEIDYIRAYASQPVGGFDAWAYGYELGGTNAAAGSDPDNDTFDNFYEYAFGGNPTNSADTGLLPEEGAVLASGGSNVLEYIYYRRSDPSSGLDYSIEYRTDLVFGSWTNFVVDPYVATGVFNAEMDAVTNNIPIDSDTKFLRVKAVSQP